MAISLVPEEMAFFTGAAGRACHEPRAALLSDKLAKHLDTTTGDYQLERRALPPRARLEIWTARAWTDGLQVDGLRDLDTLHVRTLNTLYDITLIRAQAGEAIVRGGLFFPQPTRALILGSSLGGAFLKVRGIYCGFSLELYATGTRIVTSVVQSVQIAAEPRLGRVQ
jgi:hypothetical protein